MRPSPAGGRVGKVARSTVLGGALLISLLAPAAAGLAAPPAPGPGEQAAMRTRVNYSEYILGPGDTLQIELIEVPEFSGTFSIGPDGVIYLPRLRALYVEGLTVEQLRQFLLSQFRRYVRNPEIYLRPVGYRPIRVYVGGEVARPGYYTLSGAGRLGQLSVEADAAVQSTRGDFAPGGIEAGVAGLAPALGRSSAGGGITPFSAVFPTVFDALRTAQGITVYANLADVAVTRRQPLGSPQPRLRTVLDFGSLITKGDESQNIRLFDGDVISVGRSAVIMREQLLKAGQTNLSPQFLQVYVSGRVKNAGATTLPQGSALNQAIVSAGGLQLLHGQLEFVRFTREGELDRRIFSYSPNAPAGDFSNPILMAGDIIRVQESVASAGISVLNELTGPFVGIYSVYSLFRGR